jgi:nucleotide-binding universal stress UspA family protein
MLSIRTILHPTDFSDRSLYAFHLACALTRDYSARLVVLHVLPRPIIAYGVGVMPPDPEHLVQEAKEQLNRLEVPGGNVRAERRLEEGDAATDILRVGQEIGADLIILGTHGRTGLDRLLMGSVAEQVVRQASCPVLTVSTPLATAAPGPPAERTVAEVGLP